MELTPLKASSTLKPLIKHFIERQSDSSAAAVMLI